MQTRRWAVLGVAALFPTAVLLALDFASMAHWQSLLVSAVYTLTCGGAGYFVIARTWPYTKPIPAPWNWLCRLVLLLAVGSAGTLAANVLFLLFGWMRSDHFWIRYAANLRISLVFTLIIGMAISVFETMHHGLAAKELERERALKLATEARLSSLESRLRPHFLFNALNSISALIQEDPKRAERLVERMAALLRFSLESHESGLVPLEHEMKIVTDYLEIESARFGDRLRYRIDIDPALSHALVPPWSVQTLVENSVKYAVAPSRSGGDIRIEGMQPNGALRIAVSDSGPGFDLAAAPAGHGIDILGGRLASLFGGSASLTQMKGTGSNTVTLVIPQRNGPA